MYLAAFFTSILALYALYKNKLTIPAIVLAWILGVVIYYFGGVAAFVSLVLTFGLTIVTDKLKIKDKNKKSEKRTLKQIICNVLLPTLSIIIYKIFDDKVFYNLYYMVICSSLADTMASSIGSLSKGKVFNPLSFKKMKSGESGAITLLGCFASILAGIFIGLPYFICEHDVKVYLLIIVMGFVGAYIDSILGVLVQGKYKCLVCEKIVENKIHCKKEAKLIKGYSCINNNVVNFLNNLSIFIIGYLIMVLFVIFE